MKNFTRFHEHLSNRYYVSKKRLLILILLCISVLGYTQSVGDTFVDDFITYEVTSVSLYEVEVNDFDHSSGVDAIIPSTVSNNGTTFSVTSIGPAAFEYNGPSTSDLASVIIPNSVTSIGSEAFKNQNLTTVVIPGSVIVIGNQAFIGNNLASVTLENGIESIGDNAFQNNQLNGSIIIPNSVITIGQYAFQGNQLTDVTLSNNLVTIGISAFKQNQLQGIVIPNSVTSFSDAFSYNQLTSLTLPAGLTEIGISAFRNNNLTHVTIPSTVTNIEFSAFRDNPLTTVTSQALVPPTVFTGGINDSFWNRTVIDLTIPAGTSAAYAAGGWTGFNSVTEANALSVGDTFVVDDITYEVTSVSPDTVEAIGYDIAGGTVVNIPGTISYSVSSYDVTSIGTAAFLQKGLTSVTIPNSVVSIKSAAFFGNSNLTNVTLQNGIVSIGVNAFNDCNLASITIPSTVTNIGDYAFNSNPLTDIISLATTPPTITTGTNDTFEFNRSNINLIITNNTTDEYVTNSGALWTGFKMVFEATSPTTVEVSNYNSANGTDVIIPATVTAGSNVFDVARIEDSAFENIGLTSVTIPDSVTEIGISAFNLNNLTSVTIPDSVVLIGTTAFGQNLISNLSLGVNVTDIGIGAFVDNNLSDVTIPGNVAFIGLLAFGNNPLTDVYTESLVPPTITTGTNDTFAFNRSNIHLHIPAGTMGAYVTNLGALWTGFNPVTEDALLSAEDFELTNNVRVITMADEINIVTTNDLKIQNYTLYSITGAEVSRGNESRISTTALANGIYILKLDFDSGTLVKKVLVY